MPATVNAPERSGSREQARELLNEQLPGDLTGNEITVSFEDDFVATPSYMDELVLVILVERHARLLMLANAPERGRMYAERAAARRAVVDRLKVPLGP